MQTIELVGEKSVVKFDVETLPDVDFLEHQGQRYAPKDAKREVWEPAKGDREADASVLVLDGPALEPEPDGAADQSTDQPDGPDNAQPDHAPAV